jgi:hypothetical protein
MVDKKEAKQITLLFLLIIGVYLSEAEYHIMFF